MWAFQSVECRCVSLFRTTRRHRLERFPGRCKSVMAITQKRGTLAVYIFMKNVLIQRISRFPPHNGQYHFQLRNLVLGHSQVISVQDY